MSGKPGKSGGARSGSGRPRVERRKIRVQFNLSPEAVELLQSIPAGRRSKWLETLILEKCSTVDPIIVPKGITSAKQALRAAIAIRSFQIEHQERE